MNIKDFEILSFKGLNQLKIKDCESVNIFVGKNNAGKTSILHSLQIAGLELSSGRCSLSGSLVCIA
jgi:AAA15 family ATPase/GTPase